MDDEMEKVGDPPPLVDGLCDYHAHYPLPDEVLKLPARCENPSQHLHHVQWGTHHHEGINSMSIIVHHK